MAPAQQEASTGGARTLSNPPRASSKLPSGCSRIRAERLQQILAEQVFVAHLFFKAAISSYPRLITNGFAYRQNVGRRVYAVLLDNRSCAEQVDAAASGYNAGAGAAASWTLIKVLNMCMIVLGRSHGVISSRFPAGRHEPGAQRQVPAPPPPDINRILHLAGQKHAAIFHVKSKPHPSEKYDNQR